MKSTAPLYVLHVVNVHTLAAWTETFFSYEDWNRRLAWFSERPDRYRVL